MVALAKLLTSFADDADMEIKKDPERPSAVPLREVGRHCEEQLLRTTRPRDRLVCFFVASLVNDFFSGFRGFFRDINKIL